MAGRPNSLPGPSRPLRVAWTGPLGHEGGPWFATQLLLLLAGRGVEIELFGTGVASPLLELGLDELDARVGFRGVPLAFEWDRWYSRTRVRAFLSSSVARLRAYFQLQQAVARRHRERPFDVFFQMGQPETFAGSELLARLPPVVVHPCTHARGELRWVMRERGLARRYDTVANRLLAPGYLAARALVQPRELGKPALVICPSRRFARHLHEDCGTAEDRMAVLRHPIDLDRFSPAAPRTQPEVRLAFVSRLSARKGLDLVVALSHRLDDLAGRVAIDVIGGATLWSDYSAMTRRLNARIAVYWGSMPAAELVEHYRTCSALLAPSRYEPGALVVGEALAMGLPVVVSDQVGPGEVVAPAVCRVHRDGDLDDLERQTRALLADLETQGPELRAVARREAERHFSPQVIGDRFLELLTAAAQSSAVVADRWSLGTAAGQQPPSGR